MASNIPSDYNVIKAARKVAENARASSGIFGHFPSAHTMSNVLLRNPLKIFFAQGAQKRLGMRMGGAMRERGTREAARQRL